MDILVVDDEALFREIIVHSIEQLGHNVFAAAGAAEALEEMRRGRPVDLVVSDWMMPGMSGVELCREIRRAPKREHVFVLLLTARVARADYLEAMEAGADDFLVKPFDPETLAAKVRAAERICVLQSGLAQSNQMLEQMNRKLDSAYRKLKKDIQAAAKLQLGLLPPEEVRFGGHRLTATLLPSASVSGDIYNYFSLGDESFGLYSIDVAGHGPRAAMMSFNISRFVIDHGLVDSLRTSRGLDEIVGELNKTFQSTPPDNDYFTMLLATVAADRTMRVCQAGHPHPIALPRDGSPPYPLGDGGFPVGLMEEIRYGEFSVDLSTMHRVAFYTDGVTECEDQAGEQFGIERFQKLLHGAGDLPLEEVIPTVRRALVDWRGSSAFDDDISIIVMENSEAPQESS